VTTAMAVGAATNELKEGDDLSDFFKNAVTA
jgi:hypothetical protein